MSIFSYLPSVPNLRMPRSTRRTDNLAIHWHGPVLQGTTTPPDAINDQQLAPRKPARTVVQFPFRFH
jgi:hypothetical protein